VELETFGAQYGDIVQLGSDLLVSERFRLIYAESGLCGLTGFDPVEVVKVKRRGKRLGSPPAYFKAAVPRTRAAIDQSASEFVWEDPTSICHDCRIDGIIKSYRRVILEAGTWTGEDIFYARGSTGVQIVTSRFRETCEANRILNVVFIPAEEYGHDWS
jgi:hypothetical protein